MRIIWLFILTTCCHTPAPASSFLYLFPPLDHQQYYCRCVSTNLTMGDVSCGPLMLPLSCLYVASMLPLCWLYVASILPLCCLYVGSMLPLCCLYVSWYHLVTSGPASPWMSDTEEMESLPKPVMFCCQVAYIQAQEKTQNPILFKKVVSFQKDDFTFQCRHCQPAGWVGVQVYYRELGKSHNTSVRERMIGVWGLKRLLGAGLGLSVVGSYCYVNTVQLPPILSGLVGKIAYFHILSF